MVPGKYTFMQSNLIDVEMCTFYQEHSSSEIKSSGRQWANRQASHHRPPSCKTTGSEDLGV